VAKKLMRPRTRSISAARQPAPDTAMGLHVLCLGCSQERAQHCLMVKIFGSACAQVFPARPPTGPRVREIGRFPERVWAVGGPPQFVKGCLACQGSKSWLDFFYENPTRIPNAGSARGQHWAGFCRKLLKGLQYVPRVIITDKLKSYGAATRASLPGVEHRQSRSLNNPCENSHRPTRQRESRMQGFTSAGHAQRFLSA